MSPRVTPIEYQQLGSIAILVQYNRLKEADLKQVLTYLDNQDAKTIATDLIRGTNTVWTIEIKRRFHVPL